MTQLKHRSTCRVCGSPDLKLVIDLDEQYLQGSFVKAGAPSPTLTKFPMRLVRCDTTRNPGGCGLLQLADSVAPEILYANYWYRSGVNATMRGHLKGIADRAMSIVGGQKLHVLDIGCNDGTLLRCYPETFERFGVDPSDIARDIAPPIRVANTVFPSEESRNLLSGRKFDIVTSIAMFYDIEDPVTFSRTIKDLLSPAGIWIVEASYLLAMLEQNSFDTICHEHLEYYSMAVLEFIFAKAGLRVFAAEQNSINGGSIRCYVTHADNVKYDTAQTRAALEKLRIGERAQQLNADTPYTAFQQRIVRIRTQLQSLLQSIKSEGKTIHIYGASTKGNVLLQWCGIDTTLVDCAADRNPDKHGARTLGTNIPIVSEEESRARKPDYYLVLPWHFRDEFLQRERQTIVAGTRMIFPLPEVSVIGSADLDRASAPRVAT